MDPSSLRCFTDDSKMASVMRAGAFEPNVTNFGPNFSDSPADLDITFFTYTSPQTFTNFHHAKFKVDIQAGRKGR